MTSMQRDVLFVTPPSAFTAYTGTKINAGVQHYPLLSYMFCSSYVKHHAGVSTAVFDMGIENNPWQLLPKILKLTQPKVVAMTCTTPMFREVRLIGMFAKKVVGKNTIVVHGGVHPSALPDESLNEAMCDIVVQGEGEITFAEICESKPFEDILGIAYRADDARRTTTTVEDMLRAIENKTPLHRVGQIEDSPTERDFRQNHSRPFMTRSELDSMPSPDLHLYDIYRYKNPRLIARGFPMIQAEFSRGCPFHCTFCSAEDAYRVFSPTRIIEWMEEWQSAGIKEIRIIDDQFATNMKRAKRIFRGMIEKNLRFHLNLANGVRADRVDEELLMLGKQAGLYQLGIGFESGDQVTLDSMQKGLKDGAATGQRVMQLIRKVGGLETVGFFMFGANGDTEESMHKTLAYAKELRPTYAKVTISTPFPDTRLFAELKRKDLIRKEGLEYWHDYNIHRAEGVYEHPNGLSPTLLRHFYNNFYKEYYTAWPYMWRRTIHSIVTGTIGYDVWYALKTFFPNLVPGNPRSSLSLRPMILYHTAKRHIFGKPLNNQIRSSAIN